MASKLDVKKKKKKSRRQPKRKEKRPKLAKIARWVPKVERQGSRGGTTNR